MNLLPIYFRHEAVKNEIEFSAYFELFANICHGVETDEDYTKRTANELEMAIDMTPCFIRGESAQSKKVGVIERIILNYPIILIPSEL